MKACGRTRGPITPATIPTPPATVPPYTVCLGCGCTVGDACLVDGVPCGWADPFHCTRCDLLARARRAA